MPLVTVIVAAYNVERYIEKCIESLRNQTWKELELLLIDDGSTDKSGEICDHFANVDSRVRVIHKKNGGVADVRNLGVAEARGTYLMFVDGDDYVEPEFVEYAANAAMRNRADIVILDFEEVEESTGRVDRWSMNVERDTPINVGQVPKMLITTPCPWNKLYRTKFWRETELQYPLGRNYEDLTVVPMLLAKAERIIYLDSKPLYHYILHEGSIMRSKNFQKSFEDRKAAIEDIVSYFKEQGIYNFFSSELEYLAFEHAFFVPTKEVLLYDPKSPYLEQFREYVKGIYPNASKNPYIGECLSIKDKIMLWLIQRRWYGVTILLSKIRKQTDIVRHR
ncbi:glycosyltransferase [Faecalicatena sp. AGMB00832]|uniref:Glycosyltransferase n=1 Tax=Faecalicatena faecalis TaxID=2726362 RepID=A0ABS6D627_9FIRM|nr:glycosyltransferase [Faecalicatena faecalis]MBU3877048.1 glycosyltransferase [Faecalicatena faecalis]